MAKTTKRDVWARRIAGYERSGLSRRAWCEANSVSLHTFDYWRRQLRPGAAHRPRLKHALVPIAVRAAAQVSPIEVVLPAGVVLRLSSTVDRDWLVGLLRELRAC